MIAQVSHTMRRILFLVFILMLPLLSEAQERYALLIGIGQYPDDSGWAPIHGDNDVTILRPFLLGQGFLSENISVLSNSEATKTGILSAMSVLQNKVHPGDVVYIHFSGHGQQVSDLNGDEEDGFDEAWIPYDARKSFMAGVYEGEKHLIDDELNIIFTKLRLRTGATGKIIIVADACHSGSGSRGLPYDEVFVRGTGDKFVIPGQSSSLHKKPEPTEWLFVAACKPYQSNYEYRSPSGEYYGVLSYVIARDSRQFDACEYVDLLKEWSDNVSGLSRFPQNLDNEGQPSKRNPYMF